MNSPVVHIGYPKTATKWFQHHFYPVLQDVYFLDRPNVFNILIKPDIFEFDQAIAVQQIEKLCENRRLAMCEELLLGGLDIYFGNGEFIQLMANRIKSSFPDAEIVIFIRNQKTIVESAYNQYIKSGGTYSPARYFGFKKRFKAFFKNHHLFNLKFFEYDLVIDLYKKLFIDKKVHVFLYEDFLYNPKEFIHEYCNKLSLPIVEFPLGTFENKSLSAFSLLFMRFMNRFTYKNTAFKNNLFHIETIYFRSLSMCNKIDKINLFRNRPYHLNKDLIRLVEEHYRKSNAKLTKFVDTKKLINYDYPL